jgi:hypothetical protein
MSHVASARLFTKLQSLQIQASAPTPTAAVDDEDIEAAVAAASSSSSSSAAPAVVAAAAAVVAAAVVAIIASDVGFSKPQEAQLGSCGNVSSEQFQQTLRWLACFVSSGCLGSVCDAWPSPKVPARLLEDIKMRGANDDTESS